MRRMREDHLHRNYSDVNERPIRCRAKLIQPKAGMAACLAMIPSAYNGTSCPATATSNGGSSERSSEGCNSRDAQPSAVSVSALAWGSSVRNTGVRKFTIKFRKGAALLYLIGCNRAAFHIGEQNECQCELLWCYHPAAQTGGIRTLHEKRSQQNRRPNCETDRCGYYTFDIGADIILSI